MKILHILNELKFSGAEVMLKGAKTKFESADIDTFILSTGDNQIGDFAEELIKCNYKITHIPFRKKNAFVRSILNFFKENKFDVIHIHTERFFFIYIVLAKFTNVKIICRTIHSTFVFKGLLGYRRKIMLRLGSKMGCTYFAISKGVQQNEKEQNGITPIIINNWIDTNYFKPKLTEKSSLKEGEITLISLGSCIHLKQHCAILQLVSVLKLRGYKVIYFHLGAGELEIQEKKLAEDLNITENVFFVGNQTNVLEWLYKAKFFIMPSVFEGLGNSCAEAMAAGLVPIVNDAPGLRDLVDHNINGLVVDFKNIEKVSDDLLILYKDVKKNRDLSIDARKKIEREYSLSNVDNLLHFYFTKKKK